MIFIHPSEVLYDEAPEFTVEMNYIQASPTVLVPFIHLDVYYWSASVLREMLRVWDRLRPTLPPVLFAQGTVDDDKWKKLVTKFGFVFHTDCPCDDGASRRIFVNYLDI